MPGTSTRRERFRCRAGQSKRRICGAAIALSLTVMADGLATAATERSESGQFVAHVLALRVVAVEGGGAAVLSRIAGRPAGSLRKELWQPFFENAMVALGRLRSPFPVALYYNPLVDVAIVTVWEKPEGAWQIAAIRVLPGERLDGGRDPAPRRPSWVTEDDDPIETLAATVAARFAAFHRSHPPRSSEGARVTTTFASDAADTRAAWPRLSWLPLQRVRWASGSEAWLRPTLAAITRTLSAGDPATVKAAAPATDSTTAEAVAGLPRGFADRLVLDMVLAAGGGRRLLLGSLPEDGDVYFLVLCRLTGADCRLRRIIMLSLLDDGIAYGRADPPERG